MCQFDSTYARVPVFLSVYLHFLYAYMEASQVFTDSHTSICAADRFSRMCIHKNGHFVYLPAYPDKEITKLHIRYADKKLRWCAKEEYSHTVLPVSAYLYMTQRNHSLSAPSVPPASAATIASVVVLFTLIVVDIHLGPAMAAASLLALQWWAGRDVATPMADLS